VFHILIYRYFVILAAGEPDHRAGPQEAAIAKLHTTGSPKYLPTCLPIDTQTGYRAFSLHQPHQQEDKTHSTSKHRASGFV